jgi:beta-1,4-mannosyl-glycoprotein beta-1,4-N-acetylglucosaminyltransferase
VKRIDAFPFAGNDTELLLLECRLTELYDTVDHFVIVEATVDHQDVPKPLNFLEHRERFDQWKDKIHYVVADDLPHIPPGETHATDPWAREHAQREWIAKGLEELDVDDDDIVLQSDADEIPKPLQVRNVKPRGTEAWSFHQRGHFWAVDWNYPKGWRGTVAMRWGGIKRIGREGCGPFTAMRDKRNTTPHLENAGWHFSWLGGREAAIRKVASFCHPEVADKILWDPDRYWRDGWHVDDEKLIPVDVDWTYPRWMQDPANVPATWLRPR